MEFILAIHAIVVRVLLLLEQALVAVGIVGSTWRRVHVVLVALLGAGSR